MLSGEVSQTVIRTGTWRIVWGCWGHSVNHRNSNVFTAHEQMALLFRNFRIHQVFGANTDVGKTILTSGLVRASAAKEKRVFYLKPVSTGPLQDADDEYVAILDAQCQKMVDRHVDM